MELREVVERLEDLETRVGMLERAPTLAPPRGAASGSEAQRTAWRAPVSVAAPVPRKTKSEPGTRDVEAWFGAVLLGRAGIVAVVLAAGYFAQLAYRSVSDPLKVASLYGLAVLLVAVGLALRSRTSALYAGLLTGGGAAVAYVAGLAATLRYHLVEPWTGLGLVAGAAAAGLVLAHRMRMPALCVVSVLSALLAPVLLGVMREPNAVVLGYLAIVHLAAAFGERLWGWRGSRAAALLGAITVAFLWRSAHSVQDLQWGLAMQAFALSLLLPEIAGAIRPALATPSDGRRVRIVLALAGLDAIVASTAARTGDLRDLAVVAGLAWMSFAAVFARVDAPDAARGTVRAFGGVGATLLALGTYAAVRGQLGEGIQAGHVAWVTAAGLLALALQRRVGSGDGGAAAAVVLVGAAAARSRDLLSIVPLLPVAGAALALFGRGEVPRVLGVLFACTAPFVALTRLGFAEGTTSWFAAAVLVPATIAWGIGALARLRESALVGRAAAAVPVLLALAWVVLSLAAERVPGFPPPTDPHTVAALALAAAAVLASRSLAPDAGASVLRSVLLPAATVGLVLAAGGREVHLVTRHLAGAWPAVTMSVYLTLAAGALMAGGFLWKQAGLRWTAIALFGCVALKVGIHDLAGATTPLRILVTAVLGFVLLACAYAYSRRRSGVPPVTPRAS